MWAPDPWGRYQHRYWDGARWTDHVATYGQPTIDPVPSTPPAPRPPAGLSFLAAVRRCPRNYANFRGRAARSEYWWFLLFVMVAGLGTLMLELALFGEDAVAWMTGVVYLALVVPSLAAGVRRLHDTGKTGWALLLQFVPLVGGIILLVWMTTPGDPYLNKYGLPPIAAARR